MLGLGGAGEHSTTRDTLDRSVRQVADTEAALAESDDATRAAETTIGELTRCREAGRDLIESLDADDSAATRDETRDALDRLDSYC